MFKFLSSIVIFSVVVSCNADTYTFPSTFKIGGASSAYQIEGGWDADGKSPSIWDTMTHDHPDRIADGSNGDIAANSYEFIDKDVKALVDGGVSNVK